MASSPKRIAWDSCAWISHIQQEKVFNDGKLVEDRGAMCRPVLAAAEEGKLEIVVSSISLVEVICKNKDKTEDQKVRDYFDNDYILLVSTDKEVGDRARQLMLAGHPGLKPADAIHIATAAISNADELHTFDAKLLLLTGKIDKLDGTRLKIRKPAVPAPPAPLLERIEHGEDK
jgi:predicted nucleic acid-binding protein